MLILASCNDNKERLIVENYDMYEKKLLQTIECSLINNYQTTDVMLCDFQDGQLGYQVNQVIPVENDEFIYSSQYILLDVLSNEIQICLNEDYRVECFFRKNNNEIVEIYKENYGDKYSEYSAKIFNAGKEIFTKNLTSEILKSWYVDDIYHDAENVYFNLYNDNYEGCLLVYDFDFNLVNTYNNANQQIFCYENSVEGCLFELERHELYCYDSNNNKFNKYNNFDNSQFYSFNGDSLYDFYYAEIDSTNEVEDTFLIGYKKGKYYKILSFNEMGVSDFDDFLTDNEGGFFAIDYGTNGAESIYHIENSDEVYSLKDNKIIIKVAGLYSYMNQYVEKYNEQSDKYYVEFIEYGNDLEYDEALKALYLDAQTGVEIDIISLFGLNKNDFIKNGVLEDLNISYLSRGGNISKNDFTDYSIDIMTENNGEIYSLFNEYTVGGIWGKSDFNTSLIDNYLKEDNKNDTLFANTEVEWMFSDLISYTGNKYINVNDKTINLNEDFKNILKVVKNHKKNISLFENESFVMLLKEKKCKLLCEDLRSYYDYFFYYNIFDNSLGCYTENGKTILKPGMINLSVCEKSINKLGAYDFLDFVFDYNNYNEISKNMCQGFPTLKANEEDWKQVLTASETFTNRYGDIVEPFDFEMGVDGYVCTIPPVSIEEYSLAEAFIKSAEYIEPMPDKYMDIILEESELYFEDKKSLDDTVKAIENRVTNALNE